MCFKCGISHNNCIDLIPSKSNCLAVLLWRRPGMVGLFSSFLLLLLALEAAGGEEPREPVMKSILDSWKSLRNGYSSCPHLPKL